MYGKNYVFSVSLRISITLKSGVRAKELAIKVPLIVRLEGTNVELGKDILNKSGLAIISADN